MKGEKHHPTPKKSFTEEWVISVGSWDPIPLGNFLRNHVEQCRIIPLAEEEARVLIFEVSFPTGWELKNMGYNMTTLLGCYRRQLVKLLSAGEIPQTRKEKHRSSRWKCDDRLQTVSMCSFKWAQARWVYGKGHKKSTVKAWMPRWGFFSSWWNSWGQPRNWVKAGVSRRCI